MAEKKGVGHAYNIDFLNVVFAASSIFLFLSVIWMVWDDYSREWKAVQRRFVNLEIQVTQAGLEKAQRGVDQNKLKALQTSLAEGEKTVSANQQKVDELNAQLSAVEARLYRESQAAQFAKATYDTIGTSSNRRAWPAAAVPRVSVSLSPSRKSSWPN